jgi:hypothetical protein
MSFNIPDVSRISMGGGRGGGGGSEPDFIPNPTPTERDYYRQTVFNTGSLWLGGMVAGGIYGCVEGIKTAPGRSTRIIINSALNGVSRRANVLANRLAVIAILNTTWTAVGNLVFEDTLPDYIALQPPIYAVPIFAGMATGSTFLVGMRHKNPKVYLLGAVLGGGISCAYWFYGATVYNTLFGKPKRR